MQIKESLKSTVFSPLRSCLGGIIIKDFSKGSLWAIKVLIEEAVMFLYERGQWSFWRELRGRWQNEERELNKGNTVSLYRCRLSSCIKHKEQWQLLNNNTAGWMQSILKSRLSHNWTPEQALHVQKILPILLHAYTIIGKQKEIGVFLLCISEPNMNSN